jgi:hypothetical protein
VADGAELTDDLVVGPGRADAGKQEACERDGTENSAGGHRHPYQATRVPTAIWPRDPKSWLPYVVAAGTALFLISSLLRAPHPETISYSEFTTFVRQGQ